ncbi:g754 [Coccomyxa viridis]|uniref:G754 protein n=1 Tax=Coccomyxa viridis TaxID=1274662 RepID=A0ABP1FIH3_9CHLO
MDGSYLNCSLSGGSHLLEGNKGPLSCPWLQSACRSSQRHRHQSNRFRGATPVVCSWLSSKTPAGADRKPEAGRVGLQGAFRSIWGAEKSSSNSSSNGVSSSAPRSQSSRRSRESTVTQRSRQDQNRPQRAKGQRESSAKPRGRFYWNITGFPFPLGPLLTRRTVRYEVERGSTWCFEQEQSLGGSNVSTNVRMTVIKLKSGGLFVHAPIAATRECISLVKELGYPVEHIVLPTFAVEHKLFVGPFARNFPGAKVHVAPRQWSWPLWLPVQFFGIFPDSTLVDNDSSAPWSEELEQKLFSSAVGIGPYVEMAFFHKPTRTLLTTDAVIFVPQRPPAVVNEDNLMEAGGPLQASVRLLSGGDRDEDGKSITQEAQPQNRAQQLQLGWQRMALQILYFVPYNLLQPAASFSAISQKLLVSPVLKKLVFLNSPEESRRWIEDITSNWEFKRIIPAHFAAPVPATPRDLRAAFSFVYGSSAQPGGGGPLGVLTGLLGGSRTRTAAELPATDMRALDSLEDTLRKAGVLNK